MRIVNLSKEYQISNAAPVKALQDISFELPDTGIVLILGKSGSGKSTLLKLLAGLDRPSGGDVIFHGQKLSAFSSQQADFYRNTYCGFIFQEYNLLPELSVEDNISLALEMQGEKDTKEKVEAVLRQVELDGYEKRKISELSGGQRQRVAIARALIKRPEIIFADEPTGALDNKTGNAILSLLKALSKEHLIIAVTHDREFAEKYGDRIIELEDGCIVSDSEGAYVSAEQSTFEVRRTKLPMKTAIKVGGSNFKYHPFRLSITVLLSFLLFTIFGISFSLATLDVNQSSVNSIYSSQLAETMLLKKDSEENFCVIDEEDISWFKETFPNCAFGIIRSWFEIEELKDIKLPNYYSINPSALALIDENDFAEISQSYIGRFAETQSEVMITEYTAERLLVAGGQSSFEELLEQTLTIDGESYTVCAIIDTGFQAGDFLQLKDSTKYDVQLFNRLFRALNETRHNLIYFSRDVFEEQPDYTDLLVSLQGSSKKIISELYFLENFEMRNYVTEEVTSDLSLVANFRQLFVALAVICGAFTIAVFIYFISQSIEDKAGTIALLKMMGAGNRVVRKIFLWESIILGIIVFVLSMIFCASLFGIFNLLASSGSGIALSLFNLSLIDCLILFLLTSICVFVGTAIPFYRISKIKPIKLLE